MTCRTCNRPLSILDEPDECLACLYDRIQPANTGEPVAYALERLITRIRNQQRQLNLFG